MAGVVGGDGSSRSQASDPGRRLECRIRVTLMVARICFCLLVKQIRIRACCILFLPRTEPRLRANQQRRMGAQDRISIIGQ
eukprot:575719-Hanusia_phi.AAC.1